MNKTVVTLLVLLAAIIAGCGSDDSTSPGLTGGEVSAAGSFIDAVGRPRGVVRLQIKFNSIEDVVRTPKTASSSTTVTTGPVEITATGNDAYMATVILGLTGEALELTYSRTTDDKFHLSGNLTEQQAEGAPISITFVAQYDGRLGGGNVPVVVDLANLVGTMSIYDGNTGPQSNIVSGVTEVNVRGVVAMLPDATE